MTRWLAAREAVPAIMVEIVLVCVCVRVWGRNMSVSQWTGGLDEKIEDFPVFLVGTSLGIAECRISDADMSVDRRALAGCDAPFVLSGEGIGVSWCGVVMRYLSG